jgi:holo-[acyl-carrier protein] synthase
MIIGIGIDLCDTTRVRELYERYGERFLERLFTPEELQRCRNGRRLHECLGGRFAAKEATLKALGTGLSQGIRWRDVELVSGESQPPRIVLHARAAEIAALRGVQNIHASITHDGDLAVAVVVFESGSGAPSR